MNGKTGKKSFALRLRGRATVFLHDVLMIPLAWYLAYWLRFNLGAIPEEFMQAATLALPILVICQSFSYLVFGLYRGIWRFASLSDLVCIGKSIFFGVLISMLMIFLITRMEGTPRTVIPLYAILLFVFLGGNRALYRYLKDRRVQISSGKRVLIIGAGAAAGRLLQDMLRHGRTQYLPVGLVDDDPDKTGREIHGIRVSGISDEIPDIVKKQGIDLIIIAIPSLSSERMRRLVAICKSTSAPFKTLPKFEDLISGQVTVDVVREVSIEDLLGREKIELDRDSMQAGLSGKVIMVTGGGGSIGSELGRLVADLGPDSLVIYERNEFNLYRVQQELEKNFPQVNLVTVLGDICDQRAVENAIGAYLPDVIFHAAAYKHVPLLQAHPAEAVKNNVTGTRIVAEAANKFNCDKFVFISTDKAVNPANILGATKRIGEIYCEGMNAVSATRFITVRFGNVLGSDGSIVPLFRSQIQAGGPLTVTHPEVSRYFMTIREACQLILQAVVMERQGGIFVLDMGEPIKISYLVEQMMLLAGKKPGEDIDIQYVGLRPGEKLAEELFYDTERKEETENAKILLAKHVTVDWNEIEGAVSRLEQALLDSNDDQVKKILADIVPGAGDKDSPDNPVAHSGNGG